MDAVEYLKAKTRMTKRGNGAVCNISCKDCPIGIDNNGVETNCRKLESYYPEKAVEIIEQWAAEHPKKTRQSEFLKMFPNASLDDNGIIEINPCYINVGFKPEKGCVTPCFECCREYWLEEVDE